MKEEVTALLRGDAVDGAPQHTHTRMRGLVRSLARYILQIWPEGATEFLGRGHHRWGSGCGWVEKRYEPAGVQT
jgi:hypothetical protein